MQAGRAVRPRVDGAKAGEDLAKRFKSIAPGVWEMKLDKPVEKLERGVLVVSVKDRQGNVTKIERTISVGR